MQGLKYYEDILKRILEEIEQYDKQLTKYLTQLKNKSNLKLLALIDVVKIRRH